MFCKICGKQIDNNEICNECKNDTNKIENNKESLTNLIIKLWIISVFIIIIIYGIGYSLFFKINFGLDLTGFTNMILYALIIYGGSIIIPLIYIFIKLKKIIKLHFQDRNKFGLYIFIVLLSYLIGKYLDYLNLYINVETAFIVLLSMTFVLSFSKAKNKIIPTSVFIIVLLIPYLYKFIR